MSLLARLFGLHSNPTKDWPVDDVSSGVPDVDLTQRSFGSLRFGEDIEAARFLGRPGSYKYLGSGRWKMVYPCRGVQLDYEMSQFTYLTFFVGPNESNPAGTILAQPRFTNGLQLTHDTTRDAIIKCFGEPEYEDTDDDWRILVYDFQGLAVEFSLDNEKRLTKCEVYPDN